MDRQQVYWHPWVEADRRCRRERNLRWAVGGAALAVCLAGLALIVWAEVLR